MIDMLSVEYAIFGSLFEDNYTDAETLTESTRLFGANKARYDQIGKITRPATPSTLIRRHHAGVI